MDLIVSQLTAWLKKKQWFFLLFPPIFSYVADDWYCVDAQIELDEKKKNYIFISGF